MNDLNIWKPEQSSSLYRSKTVDEKRCRWGVLDFTGWHFLQCSRLVKETLDNYGFCGQHAKMWKRDNPEKP